MNDQLLNHLQEFNDGNDQSRSGQHRGSTFKLNEGHANGTSRIGGVFIWAQHRYNQLVDSDSWRDDVHRCLWVLPVGVIMIEYIGILLSSSITVVGFIVLIVTQSRKKDRISLQSLTRTTEAPPFNGIDQVTNCRREVSRLLGWVGAPALDWADLNFSSDIDTKPIDVSQEAASMVVDFLEAHAQLLVTVDEAYQWLRVSASLHLGLGPLSHCVDRVERACIARKLRKGGKGANIQGVAGPSASRRVVGIPIVSLLNMRGILAQQIVDQYDSLRVLFNCMQDELELIHCMDPEDRLHIPDVVDLAWIRDARQRVATTLSDCINLCATTDALVLFTNSSKLRFWMEESKSSARNTHEFVQANLLLGAASIGSSPRPNTASDPLDSSLVTYREQLVALLAATWSCEQSADSNVDVSEDSRRDWWNRMQELTSRCRAIESDIALRFVEEVDEGANSKEQDLGGTEGGRTILMATDFQLSDDGVVTTPAPKAMEAPTATKTKVFKGHGAKLDRPAHVVKKNEGNGETTNLRSRDFVLEQQMIQELRKRITLMRPLDDDDSDHETEAQLATKTRRSREPAPPIFLGASGLLLNELKMSLPMPSHSAGQEEEILL